MPARDVFHDAVRVGLEKEGWIITHDPLLLRVGGVEMSVDLGAETLLAAEKEGQRIAVEIKSFVSPSAIFEFHTALGQFLNYRQALEEQEPERTLYLAIPADTYGTFFTLQFVQQATDRHQLKLIVYETEGEVIVKWQR
jgi:hypothetical protein